MFRRRDWPFPSLFVFHSLLSFPLYYPCYSFDTIVAYPLFSFIPRLPVIDVIHFYSHELRAIVNGYR